MTCSVVGVGQPPSRSTKGTASAPETLGPRQEQRHDRRDRHRPPGRQLSRRNNLTQLARPAPTPSAAKLTWASTANSPNSCACGCRRSTATTSTSTTRPHATPASRPVIDTLTAWWETDFHDGAARRPRLYRGDPPGRRATVAGTFGARHDALAEHFSQEEILEIIGIVIFRCLDPIKLAEGASPGAPSRRCREPARLPKPRCTRQRTRGREHRRHGGHARWRLRAFSLKNMTDTKDPATRLLSLHGPSRPATPGWSTASK